MVREYSALRFVVFYGVWVPPQSPTCGRGGNHSFMGCGEKSSWSCTVAGWALRLLGCYGWLWGCLGGS